MFGSMYIIGVGTWGGAWITLPLDDSPLRSCRLSSWLAGWLTPFAFPGGDRVRAACRASGTGSRLSAILPSMPGMAPLLSRKNLWRFSSQRAANGQTWAASVSIVMARWSMLGPSRVIVGSGQTLGYLQRYVAIWPQLKTQNRAI